MRRHLYLQRHYLISMIKSGITLPAVKTHIPGEIITWAQGSGGELCTTRFLGHREQGDINFPVSYP